MPRGAVEAATVTSYSCSWGGIVLIIVCAVSGLDSGGTLKMSIATTALVFAGHAPLVDSDTGFGLGRSIVVVFGRFVATPIFPSDTKATRSLLLQVARPHSAHAGTHSTDGDNCSCVGPDKVLMRWTCLERRAKQKKKQ